MVHPGVEQHLPWADEVWHAGDLGPPGTLRWFMERSKVFRAVAGNADPRETLHLLKDSAFFEVEGLRVLIHHIVGKPGKYTPQALGLVQKLQPDWVECGHSHILLVSPLTYVGQRPGQTKGLHINPGAAGQHGFHPMCTMLKFEVENKKVLKAEAVELGPRGRLTAAEAQAL